MCGLPETPQQEVFKLRVAENQREEIARKIGLQLFVGGVEIEFGKESKDLTTWLRKHTK